MADEERDAFGRARTTAPEAPPPASTPRQRGGLAVGITVAVVVIVAAVLAALLAVGGTVSEVGTSSAPTPQPVQPSSFLGQAGFQRVLDILERDVPGDLDRLRLAPTEAVAVVFDGDERITARLAGSARAARITDRQTGAGRPDRLAGYDGVDTTAPGRLVRAANGRLDERTDDVTYLLYGADGAPGWVVQYADGRQARGDRHGRPTG